MRLLTRECDSQEILRRIGRNFITISINFGVYRFSLCFLFPIELSRNVSCRHPAEVAPQPNTPMKTPCFKSPTVEAVLASHMLAEVRRALTGIEINSRMPKRHCAMLMKRLTRRKPNMKLLPRFVLTLLYNVQGLIFFGLKRKSYLMTAASTIWPS